MNLSVLTTKKLSSFQILSLLLAAVFLGPSCHAQDVDSPVPAPLNWQERMQKSISRQMEAVAAMRKSIEARQQSLSTQGNEASANSFFTLPAPTPLAPLFPPVQREAAGEIDNTDNKDVDENLEQQPQSPAPVNPPETSPAPSKTTGGPKTIVLPSDIAAVKEIQGIDGFGASAAGDLSLEGILLRQFAASDEDKATQPPLFPSLLPVSDGKDRDASGTSPTHGPGTIDYLRQILDFSIGGSSLFQGLTGVR
jgi:hypothetical protein